MTLTQIASSDPVRILTALTLNVPNLLSLDAVVTVPSDLCSQGTFVYMVTMETLVSGFCYMSSCNCETELFMLASPAIW